MRALILIAVIGTLSGCATQYWNFPPGGSNLQFNQDSYACTQDAQEQSSSAYVNSYGGTAQSGTYTNANLYNQCMYARGYSLGKKLATPPKSQLPDAFYVDLVRQQLTASKCVADGLLAPELGVLLNRSSDDILTNYIYDQKKMSETWRHESSTFAPSQSDCDGLAAFAVKLKALTP